MGTVGNGVVDSQTKELLSSASVILADNGEGTEGKTTVADTVPVTTGIVCPPTSELVIAVSVRNNTTVETKLDHVRLDGSLLLIGPNVVKPVIGDGECGSQFSSVEEVSRVPFGVVGRSETIADSILVESFFKVSVFQI